MKQIDLNQLKVLRVLLEVKNTREAARRLNTSQPAVSRSLANLRVLLDDPLFIRCPNGLEPTPRSLELALSLPLALDGLMDTVFGVKAFDPQTFSGKVTIALNGSIAQWLGPVLIEQITQKAPKIKVLLANWQYSSVQQLLDGEVQIGVNYFPLESSKQLIQRKIGEDQFVVITRKGHPLRKHIIEPVDFGAYPMAFHFMQDWNDDVIHSIESLKEFNVEPYIQLRSSHLSVILQALKRTDMLLPCSLYMAKALGTDYRIYEISEKITQPNSDFAMLISTKMQKSPLILWLQKEISQCVQDILFAPAAGDCSV
ncbi:LysR family transcriptional regulator [Psychromonas aquimarina]|uniref:LysR family transcriptional regulator n=1 Tax=Psychromonas aquimarina TaxID=444919 RepID=UPI0004026D35|nr:LysR substrate-binding domain-containing protein [Psychromonas aquimarina]